MLTRLKQIAIKEETREDVVIPDTGLSGAVALYFPVNMAFSVINPSTNFDLQTFERQINRDTLTMLRGLTGMKMGMMKFSLEMSGNTTIDGTVFPEFDLPLRACGFRRETLLFVPLTGTITNGGLIRHGDTVTQQTSGAKATVVQDTYSGMNSSGAVGMWITQSNGLGTGTIDTAGAALTWTATTASASPAPVATQSSAASLTIKGVGWWPQSFPLTVLRTKNTGILLDIPDGTIMKGVSTGAFFQKYGTQGFSNPPGTGYADTDVYVRRLQNHAAVNQDIVDPITPANVYFTTNGAATTRESQFQIPTLTMGGLYDGVRESIAGARGNVKIRMPIGEPAMLDFDFKGKKSAFLDGGLISGISYTQALPPVILDADISVGDDGMTFALEPTPNVSSVEFDMANDIQYRKSIDQASGLLEAFLGNRKPTYSIDPECLPESFIDWMAMFTGNLNFRYRSRVGTTNGNKFLITAPGLAITAAQLGDRDGIQTRQITGNLTSGGQTTSTVAKDNELVIIWQLA